MRDQQQPQQQPQPYGGGVGVTNARTPPRPPPLGVYLEEAGLCMLDASRLPALALPPSLAGAPAGARRAPADASRLPPIGASPDAFVVRVDGSRLVVEVKNVCPFVLDRKRPGGFCVARDADSALARGPHEQLLVTHVPQFQLEMLCAGCASGLLVSSSACAGINVFRAARDDAYLALLLHFVGVFYTRHVRAGVPPGADFFPTPGDAAEGSLYDRLLARTAELAREAVLERHIAQPWRTAERSAFFTQ